MTTTLITGGNKGLGYETARRLAALGHDVWIGARDEARGQAAADALGARFVQLDVTSVASVAAAAASLDHLDVLVNNAAITGGRGRDAADLDGPAATEVFDTNLVGPIRVLHAFLPLLLASAQPVVVNVSSGLGSFAAVTDTSRVEAQVIAPLYCASKSGLTMLTLQYARALPAVRFNAVDPGYTATDLNDHSGPQTVTEGTDAIVAMATIGADGPTGTFTDRFGTVPW